MKNLIKVGLVATAMVGLALLFTHLMPNSAEAQPFSGASLGTTEALSNQPTPVVTSATTNFINARPISVRNKQGASVFVRMGTTNAVSCTPTGVGVGFGTSDDGTNYTTTPVFWVVGTGANTAGLAVAFGSNIPPVFLDNFQWFKAITCTNGNTNTMWLSNVTVGYF